MGHFMIECEDGGFMQVGETYFLVTRCPEELYVVKTNIDGSKMFYLMKFI